MKLINEKLGVAEYKYPYYEKINPILFSYIMGVPNDPQHPNNVRAKMTSRNLENKELDKLIKWIIQILERDFVVKAINKGLIDVIVSDHKPEDEESKRLTFSQAATGASGIETLLALSLELFHNGSVKLFKLIELLTNNPAKILKINKGNLSVGGDADFCIVDIYKPWIVKKEKIISKSKNTCIEDKKLQGLVTNTFVKGEELFKI